MPLSRPARRSLRALAPLLLAASAAAQTSAAPAAAVTAAAPDPLVPAPIDPPARPFGTLRSQAELEQRWLEERMATVLPMLMREHGVDMWIVPMREYNEDPTFSALVSPTTFAARRRTIYVFFDKCAAGDSASVGASGGAAPRAAPPAQGSPVGGGRGAAAGACVEKLALGGA